MNSISKQGTTTRSLGDGEVESISIVASVYYMNYVVFNKKDYTLIEWDNVAQTQGKE